MQFRTKTELGFVSVKDTAIKTIAGRVAVSCYGVTGLADRKTHRGPLKEDDNIERAIKVSYNDGLIIDIHICVMYGMNIQNISETILDTLSFILKDSFGLKVNKVNVNVEGFRMDK